MIMSLDFQISLSFSSCAESSTSKCHVDADPVVDDLLAVVDHSHDVPVHEGYGFQGSDELAGEVLDV